MPITDNTAKWVAHKLVGSNTDEIYVGSEQPEGYKIYIDPNGEGIDEDSLLARIADLESKRCIYVENRHLMLGGE